MVEETVSGRSPRSVLRRGYRAAPVTLLVVVAHLCLPIGVDAAVGIGVSRGELLFEFHSIPDRLGVDHVPAGDTIDGLFDLDTASEDRGRYRLRGHHRLPEGDRRIDDDPSAAGQRIPADENGETRTG